MTDKPNVPLPPSHVDPLTTTWRAGRRLYRVHPVTYAPNQFDTAKALFAYGDRLKTDDFAAIDEPERLDRGRGYRRAQEAASAAGITIAEG